MTKKIFRSIFIVAMAILLACLVLIMGVMYEYFTSMQQDQLKLELELASEGVESSGKVYLSGIDTDSCRLTWVDSDGTVIFDSKSDAGSMENHGDREEIKEAMQTGFGESSRYSTTLTEKTLYYAKLMSDGTVLRASVSHATIPSLVLGMLQPIMIVFVLAIVLSLVLANRLSKRIVEPLNSLDLDKPLENSTYDELSPLLNHIEQQHRQINSQLTELETRKHEFYAVIRNMNEGLVLLNRIGTVLSINPAAAEFFNADPSCVGRDFLTLERSLEVGRALKKAAAEGRSELQLDRHGREYQLNASRIEKDGEVSGIVLLVFDITDRVFAERNRREFTANVSHELKTPLQTIMGSAELMENGLVKPEDVPEFVGRIRSEAARLVSLIEDIIRLSQLDESDDLPEERVELLSLAREEVRALTPAAEARAVTMSVEGECTEIIGVRQLLHEVIANLCDNAIKYNSDGGSVTVRVGGDDNGAFVSVSDTGIGIPPEHQARVFERFYRVDKSHSRSTGGTGLGLSIVKHAVQYMGGAVKLESAPGNGTTITVSFKKA